MSLFISLEGWLSPASPLHYDAVCNPAGPILVEFLHLRQSRSYWRFAGIKSANELGDEGVLFQSSFAARLSEPDQVPGQTWDESGGRARGLLALFIVYRSATAQSPL